MCYGRGGGAKADGKRDAGKGPGGKGTMKNRHNQYQELVNWIVMEGIERGLGHLTIEDTELGGRMIQLHGKDVVNFGSASYLGLELDPRLAVGTIDAVKRFGTQYSSSRAYVASGQYPVLEELLAEVFGAPVVVTPSTTLGHLAAIPTMVQDGDVVVMDHEVHASVQMACDVVKARGVQVETIPHNSMDALVEKVESLRWKYKSIWYMIDGVYSMHGDFAPLETITRLMDQHEQLHVYMDDAHGMSWAGEHGRGHALATIKLHERMLMATSLNKAFGASGGVLVFPNQEWRQRVRNCGRPLIFSGPIQPPMLGADIASAKIHLSPEIEVMQAQLRERVDHCNKVIKANNLPLAAESESPIFFIKAGMPTVGGNLMKRMMNDGYYVNVGIFPAVAWQDTGIRFAVNRHHTLDDITRMVETLAYHLPLAKKEEMSTRGLLRNILKFGPNRLMAVAAGA